LNHFSIHSDIIITINYNRYKAQQLRFTFRIWTSKNCAAGITYDMFAQGNHLRNILSASPSKYSRFMYSFIYQGTSTRRQRRDLFCLRVKLSQVLDFFSLFEEKIRQINAALHLYLQKSFSLFSFF